MLVQRHARSLGLVQNANERSSHKGAKPTGGGLGIIVAAALAGLWIAPGEQMFFLVPAAAAVGLGLVGLADDVKNLNIRLRFLAQALFVLVIIIYLQWVFDLSRYLEWLGPVWLALPIVAVAGVLWINLFNFMDGIDGLAASEAVFVLSAMILLVLTRNETALSGIWLWLAAIVVAALVFLIFNWQPARIFLGDAGAYFFAAAIVVATLSGLAGETLSPAAAIILVAVFVADGMVTLGLRVYSGQRWSEGHRTHAYQHLSRRWSHARVVVLYMGMNLAWLLPLALAVQNLLLNPLVGVLLAYAPLILFMLGSRAGQPEHD